MKLTIENEKFRIQFFTEKDTHHDGTEKINTACNIFKLDKNTNFKYLISKSIVKLNHKDKYDKITGKKIALTRALDATDWFSVQAWTQNEQHNFVPYDVKEAKIKKARRTKVWKAFNKEFRKVK